MGVPTAIGRSLAETGAVTLQQNSLSGTCSGVAVGSGGLSSGLSGGLDVARSGRVSILPSASVPEPSALSLLLLGLIVIGFAARTRRPKPGAS